MSRMKIRPLHMIAVAALLYVAASARAAEVPAEGHYGAAARDVMDDLQKNFYDAGTGLYMRSDTERSPDYMWANGVVFSALVGAARHDPKTYRPIMDKFYVAMDGYWDAKAAIPGYEAVLGARHGVDRYYDDNAWMVITYLEAYDLTSDARYRNRASQTLHFVRSGWDEQLGGGIWWHERHKDGTKNTCSNAPAAVGCLRLAQVAAHDDVPELVDAADKIVTWTTAHLQDTDGLFHDRQVVATGEIKHGKLSYNAGLMVRAYLALYRRTGEARYLDQAKRVARAADGLIVPHSGMYRDGVKFAQFMVEADLELYRQTKENYLIERARKNADGYYDRWKRQAPDDLISNAATARVLWLMADTETEAGRAFWEKADDAGRR
jgi:rhamnogalacturonyl hydrolase YesR